MSYRYIVLGAGRQGVAGAHDLALHGDAALVTLADIDPTRAEEAAARLRALVPGVPFAAAGVDATDEEAVQTLLEVHHAALSAMSYKVNVSVTRAAIAAGCHVNDLGGNTGVVRAQLAMGDAAQEKGVSVVPDCGLAPGLGNLLVMYALEQFPEADTARVRCGGLPQKPQGPLDYMLVFSVEGLTNEYMGEAEILEGGALASVPTFTGHEELTFGELGRLEAFYTSGGISTLADTMAGRLTALDYKTIRYPGHFAKVRTLIDLGYLDLEPVEVDGQPVVPRALTHALWEKALAYPHERDLVALRVEAEGSGKDGARRTLRLDLLDRFAPVTGFSAMERTTAYPAAMVTALQAKGVVKPGAHRLEAAFPVADYVKSLGEHDMKLVESWVE